ncbi:hypothetical protein SKAU_G00077160 [Synaphobranchus kaupii]|uniref:Uncharacterized protein n=1 Tax=Synaphobranchus kaupii TaxID=118154 RepID=A0A9Q1G8U1_SYNKA|nr:hypothetical protein SKAU_G00077120 [Synaphobranchus kaupii]KAJ8377136.1 hypothetical protein SKAU_G00077160 [Synaphobranchus kaupii]
MAGTAIASAVIAGATASIHGVILLNFITKQSLNAASRSVSIYLSNCSSNILINPQVYTYSGNCFEPPQPTVEKGVTEISFGSTTASSSGAVGVMTYDITEDRKNAVKRLAIMFSVPYNYNHYENWFALGLFDPYQACDESLYDMMYNKVGTFERGKAVGTEIRFQSGKFTLRGNMSPVAKAEMKVELWED